MVRSNRRNRVASSAELHWGSAAGGGGGGCGREDAQQETVTAAAIPAKTPRRNMVVKENLK